MILFMYFDVKHKLVSSECDTPVFHEPVGKYSIVRQNLLLIGKPPKGRVKIIKLSLSSMSLSVNFTVFYLNSLS